MPERSRFTVTRRRLQESWKRNPGTSREEGWIGNTLGPMHMRVPTRFVPTVKLDPSQVRVQPPGDTPIGDRKPIQQWATNKVQEQIGRFIRGWTGTGADLSKFDKTLAEIHAARQPSVTLSAAKSRPSRLAPAIRSLKASKAAPRATARRRSRI